MGMGFRRLPAFALAAFAALAIPPAGLAPIEHGLEVDGHRYRRQRRGKGQNNRRGKGLRNPPKARSNRLIVSKRVRRKHRRAA